MSNPAPMPSPPSPEGEQRSLTTVASLITAAVALGVGLYVLRSVAIPLVLAVFLTYVVSPAVDFLQMRLRAPRGLALVLTLVLGVGLFLGLVFLIVQSVAGLEDKADLYTVRLQRFAFDLFAWLRDLGVDVDPAQIQEEIQRFPLKDMAVDALGSLAAVLSNAVLTLLFFLFIIVSQSPWDAPDGVWVEIDRSVNRYLRAKLITSTMLGITTGGILFGFGVDLAFVFGVIGFLLNFIPTIGSLLVIVAALPLAFVTLDPLLAVAAIGAIVVAQNVIGNVFEPRLMGAGLDLHPATILISLGLWGLIWGVVGMLLSAPLTAIVKVVLNRYQTTRPVAELLAGRVGSNVRRTTVSL